MPHVKITAGQADVNKTLTRLENTVRDALKTVDEGESPFAPDLEPVDERAQVFEFFDADTGDYVWVWRVACVGRHIH